MYARITRAYGHHVVRHHVWINTRAYCDRGRIARLNPNRSREEPVGARPNIFYLLVSAVRPIILLVSAVRFVSAILNRRRLLALDSPRPKTAPLGEG
jgi:hypothetical protein